MAKVTICHNQGQGALAFPSQQKNLGRERGESEGGGEVVGGCKW